MNGSREGTRSPQQGQGFPQPAGLGLDAGTTQHFSGPYDQNISPTSNEPYNNYQGGNQFMGQMQPGAYAQNTLSSNDFQGYKRTSISGQRPSELPVPSPNNPFPDYNAPFSASSDNGFMLDPSLQNAGQPQDSSINPADIMGNISPSSTGGHMNHSPQHSPSMPPGQFYSPRHSRNTSLDPSSANISHGQPGDWSQMPAYRHQRAPSEHSDISSVNPSPYMKQDGFEPNHSPLLTPQHDASYTDALRMDQFSISDQQNPGAHVSPRHSPYPSPRLSPNTLNLPEQNQFVLGSNAPPADMGNQFGPVVFNNQDPHGEMGQAGQMAPPEINVVYAPPSRHNEANRGDADLEGLSPQAQRGRRNRAKSDPSVGQMSRPLTPSDVSPQLLGSDADQRRRSLSPFDSLSPNSREVSPNRSQGSRRSSTSSIPNRDYILDLADPQRPNSDGNHKTRVQKHPATFQCNLCPKRFTRAYNLRSHLRTHTDERPFVCTVCGKAFARQHDRKRHEGLHSGEKKFVCKGDLAHSGSWGCGRRFARADALGRHFRSEAGRVCIKPLLDEEAAERQRMYDEQMMGQQGLHPGMQPPQTMDSNGGFTLPAALLAQYPALGGIQWDQLGAGGQHDEPEGRSSFDASSGGEFYDDEEGGYVSGPGTAYGNAWSGGQEWASDYEGR